MTASEIAQLLEKLGCPPEKCAAMAFQLDRRARMDAARKQISYDSALEHLIGLMTQGWAAQPNSKETPGVSTQEGLKP